MRILLLLAAAAVCSTPGQAASPEAAQYWPQWRGPLANGVAPHARPPLTWSETRNIRWKVEIPGLGHATPIIWKDHVYIQTAVPKAAAGEGGSSEGVYQFDILAYERKTGKLAWRHTACETKPHESGHEDGSQASSSPVTDGEHLLAYFGSRGLYCLDLTGKQLWKKDFGDMSTRRGFGEGSSPALHGNTVVVNWDHEGDSFIVAVDKRTGEELWRRNRDEPTSWSTPVVIEGAGKTQVVVSATNRVRSYDLASGELLWECGGQTANAIPTPVFGHGLLFAMSGFRGEACRAIRVSDATGDVTEGPAVAWRYDQDTPYVPSPLLYGTQLYFVKKNTGILTSLDALTGKPHFSRERIDGIEGVYASPVGADGRVYLAGRRGTTVVFEHGPQFKVLATSTLDDGFDASPALAGDELYLRGHKHLYCIAETAQPSAGTPPAADAVPGAK